MSQSSQNMTYQQYLASLQRWLQPSQCTTPCHCCQRGKMNQSPPNPGPFSGLSEEFVAGTFKSVRAFRVGEYNRRVVLAPMSVYLDVYYDAQTWYIARCSRIEFLRHNRLPVADCSCGFYSFYSESIMKSEGVYYWSGMSTAVTALAVVENSGKVLHGEYGLRSERMRILGIHIYGPDSILRYRRMQLPVISKDRSSYRYYDYNYQDISSYRVPRVTRQLKYSFPMYSSLQNLLAAHPLDAPPE